MTDSIKACLDLRVMPRSARRKVEMYHAQTKNKSDNNVGDRYSKPISAISPLSGMGMMHQTYWEGTAASGRLQAEIVSDINVPNALTGQNCEHGTSVFAAGVAALELLKLWMVCDGVPSEAVDLLTTRQVTLNGATVTYLLKRASEAQARADVLRMATALRILGFIPTWTDSTNGTFYVHRNGYTIAVYHKTNFSHCDFQDGSPAEILQARARRIIRIEVYMQRNFLVARGWETLESWRNAYPEGRYNAIFDELVRGMFKLDVVLRQKAPRSEAMKSLTATERAIVRAYLAGTPADALPSIKAGATGDARSKIKSKWKKCILEKLGININIPWKQHKELRHAELDRLLQYPGDHHPDAFTAKYSFWKGSWPAMLKRIKTLRRVEVARQFSA